MLKFDPRLWPYPSIGDHDLTKLEYTLPKYASTQVSVSLAY